MSYNAITADVLQRITTDAEFAELAGQAYAFQSTHCAPYRDYLAGIGATGFDVNQPCFLPIELFKSHEVRSTDAPVITTFKSSGTGAAGRSRHDFVDLELYQSSAVHHFESLDGSLKEFRILALLPSYLEQGESSLVFMTRKFMEHARTADSAFYLHDFQGLTSVLNQPYDGNTLLIGVSYALLDLASTPLEVKDGLVVMETGGMKGRKRELTRAELHAELISGFGISEIHSEYGMTELSSQGYALGDGWFQTPPWMKCFVTDISDPLTILPQGRRGCLAFIDLANRDSCCYIQTRDIGIIQKDGRFSVEGRMDDSDVRGCNLLYT